MPLKPSYKAKVSAIKPRVYPLEHEARHFVDDTFDEMHFLGRLKFTSKHTPFNFSVFVVWKLNSKGKKKNTAVVDIQKLNNMVFPDSYLLRL